MKFACLIKLVGFEDLYVSPGYGIDSRENAFVGNYDEAVFRAQEKFGSDWQNHAAITELTLEEWFSRCGRRGGKVMSHKKLLHLRRLAKLKSAQAKRRKGLRSHPTKVAGRDSLRNWHTQK